VTATVPFPTGGYGFIPGVFQYSAGVAAEPGFEIERVRLRRPVPLAEGFCVVAAQLAARGRPVAAFAACELRSPAPFNEAEFAAFNRAYIHTLERWGLYRDGLNPVARSNVCPEVRPPTEPCLYAFSYTVPAPPDRPGSFVVAGSGEAPEGKGSYRDHLVAPGDTSPAGLRAKARWVLGEMERRLKALGFGWADATATQLYTVFDAHPFLADELAARGVMEGGLTCHYCRPPVVGIDYEMDVRGVRDEIVR
jgi:hypothetical protein